MNSDGGSGETKVDAGGDGAAINIRCSNGSKFTVRTNLDLTIRAFKAVLAQNCDVPADQQRLIYKGRILKDNDTLESYGLQSEHTIHMVRGSAPPAAAPSPAATAATNNPLPGATRGVGSNDSGLGGLGSSLFPGVGANSLGGSGNAGLFGAGLPGFEQVQQQLTQNPNMMRELMNTPAIQSLMNNPELMRGLIMSNPQMREIMDRNPELAHVLNDPGILRQTLEVARNPELMREMMRNTDRAMSNIEATPEGFNMLRRMYENVQEPFLNATATGANNRNELGSNPFAALLGSQDNTQARNGTNNTSSTGSEATAGGVAPNTNPLPNPWGSAGGTQTNTAPRTNPTVDVRPPSTGGLGASGLSQLDQLFAGMPDSTSMNQMQNQAVSNMMQSVLSNPQYMNQVLSLNPQLRSMVELNPQLREMLQNPEFVRQLTSPEMMQQMMTMQQSLLSHLTTTQQPNQEQGQTGAAPGGGGGAASGPGLDMLLNMFGGLGMGGGGGGGLSAPTTPDVAAEEVYATQLSQLQEMGFFDTQENIRALRATSGNVHAAVDRLLGNLGQ